MFFIPKAGNIENADRDKPFNSPNSSSTAVNVYRNAQSLRNVDNPTDRIIGYLHNPNNNDYLIGMAVGYSLINGDTKTEKRIQNCLIGDDSYHRLMEFHPGGNPNKCYMYAVNASPFNDYYFPNNFFKEVNYYVSYFDISKNNCFVYWYKDGNKYVIYVHNVNDIKTRLAINVPEFMEGLSLNIVEITSNSELLTEIIQNSKFFVNFNSTDCNYIVVTAN